MSEGRYLTVRRVKGKKGKRAGHKARVGDEAEPLRERGPHRGCGGPPVCPTYHKLAEVNRVAHGGMLPRA